MRQQASAVGTPSSGVPVGVASRAPWALGLASRKQFMKSCVGPSRALTDGFQGGNGGNHLSWHAAQYDSRENYDFDLGS